MTTFILNLIIQNISLGSNDWGWGGVGRAVRDLITGIKRGPTSKNSTNCKQLLRERWSEYLSFKKYIPINTFLKERKWLAELS